MARTRHIAGVLGLYASTARLERLPADVRALLERAALEAADPAARRWGRTRTRGHVRARAARHDDPRDRRHAFPPCGRAALGARSAGARRRSLARGDPRVTDARRPRPAGRSSRSRDRALHWTIAVLVVAQARGRRAAGRRPSRPAPSHSLDRGDRAAAARLVDVRRRHRRAAARAAPARHRARPSVLRTPRRAAVDRGLRLVLLVFFLGLVVPAWRLTVASAGERLPASGLSGAAISAVLPVALLLMCAGASCSSCGATGWRLARSRVAGLVARRGRRWRSRRC